jgi:type II secretory pathway pseudopilin PulG
MNNRKILYIFGVVVLVFGGIAILLPNFLNQQGRAKEVNAQNILGAINRAQQVHYMEREHFTDNYRLLNKIIDESSFVASVTPVKDRDSYNYTIPIAQTNIAVTTATPKKSDEIREFVGIIYRNPSTNEINSKICATKTGWFTSSTIPQIGVKDVIKNDRVICPNNMEKP